MAAPQRCLRTSADEIPEQFKVFGCSLNYEIIQYPSTSFLLKLEKVGF